MITISHNQCMSKRNFHYFPRKGVRIISEAQAQSSKAILIGVKCFK